MASTALLAAVAFALASSSPAAADGCPSTDDGYTSNCGPTFAVPSWTDAGGWSDPSQYSTIQLADFNGDGRDELLGRSDAGLEIYRFDTTLGQWRPQVDASGVPQLLSEFTSFLPSSESNPANPNQAKFYSTIQAADIDGQPGEEILARFQDGMHVYQYTPPAGGNGIDGGSWRRFFGGPFGDAAGYDDASLYSTIGVGQFRQGDRPLLFARKHSSGFPDAPLVFYKWDGAAWDKVAMPYDYEGYFFDFIDSNCSQPSCYLSLQASNLAPGGRGNDSAPGSAPDDSAELTGRTRVGAGLWDIDALGRWSFLNLDYDFRLEGLPPFADGSDSGYPDCPFSAGGATGAGSADCVGSSPSYYETFQAADVDGVPGDELLARASDGLRVRKWVPGSSGGSWNLLTTLTAPAGAASSVPGGLWGSIRIGNVDGIGWNEVLVLDPNGTGLQAWAYDPGPKVWNLLRASPSLQLGSDPWLSRPEYYSTIQVGDVDGDGRDDVVARGPYGIRTWFYDRRGTGGWERYLDDGYPSFATAAQNDAFGVLNSQAKAQGVITGTQQSVRDVWASENAPADTWPGLQTDLLAIGNCSGQTSLRPPQYAACTPPVSSPSPAYSGDEWAGAWTAVINELMVENDDALKAVAFFAELKGMRDDLFLQENAELPAIGGDLGLQAAAGSTAQFDMQAYMAGGLGIAASIAGAIPGGTEASAILWVGSEIASLIPQSSPTATSTFPSTYAGLAEKFAQMVSETEKGIVVMSQQVRGDASLLRLVGQLRRNGVWTHGRHRPQERRQPGLRHLGLPGAHAHRLRPLRDHELLDRLPELLLRKRRLHRAGGAVRDRRHPQLHRDRAAASLGSGIRQLGGDGAVPGGGRGLLRRLQLAAAPRRSDEPDLGAALPDLQLPAGPVEGSLDIRLLGRRGRQLEHRGQHLALPQLRGQSRSGHGPWVPRLRRCRSARRQRAG